MNVADQPRKLRQLTSESRSIRSGALGGKIDGRSVEGRFLRRCEAELIAEIGGAPTFSQTMLIKRCSMAMLRLQLLDQKAAEGNWSDHDGRVSSALNNAVRLFLKEIRTQAKASSSKSKAPDLADYLSQRKAEAAR